MNNAIQFICTMLQVLLTGYFIGASVRHFKQDKHFLFGVDVALAIYCLVGITAITAI